MQRGISAATEQTAGHARDAQLGCRVRPSPRRAWPLLTEDRAGPRGGPLAGAASSWRTPPCTHFAGCRAQSQAASCGPHPRGRRRRRAAGGGGRCLGGLCRGVGCLGVRHLALRQCLLRRRLGALVHLQPGKEAAPGQQIQLCRRAGRFPPHWHGSARHTAHPSWASENRPHSLLSRHSC